MQGNPEANTQTPHTRFVSHLTRSTFAMILAGGRGSRLMQLTDWRAKPAVPFGGKFRIIDFTLSNCVNSGIRRIGVATQYKAQSLIHHLQRGWSFLDGRFDEFIELLPAQQQITENWYQGTADAVYQNLDHLRRTRPKHVLILSGDHIYKMDYGRMLAEHASNQAQLSVACIDIPIEEAQAFGIMQIDETQRVLGFSEKPQLPQAMPGRPDRALASMGVYVFDTDYLIAALERDAHDPQSAHDFGKDLIPHAVNDPQIVVHAHNFADSCVGMTAESGNLPYWRDVGTIDAYWEANMELTKITPELNLYDEDWPIWTWQEQLPPAKFIFDDAQRRGVAIDSLISGGNIISGATVRRSLLFSRVRVHSYATVEDSVILPKADIGRSAKVRRAVIDKHCRIAPGMSIGYDEKADRQRFHVTDKGIVLVTPEMLGQNIHHIP
ncbi:glucose-1-phosphate adenylyltransferase [Sterolibacterium denitrificans]|uniref:Glucose-1-phosphate adenylyltransferase n=1 Tax=Sterolibacterium denitrificans TaxID=157592 RepID=A0A7Z7HQ61_9PROT|nr:glucose-1-phosphate adenylyltransferase [Sterolibacterium denitrificans]SMB23929.1 glucose-1-phosphate adenylyltransferase [Sterolibacterium denitrificans]